MVCDTHPPTGVSHMDSAIFKNPLFSKESHTLSKDDEQYVNRMNALETQKENKPIRAIYIDLACLRDYKLGALLKLVDSIGYQYIVSRLPIYNDRLDEDILSYFPDVDVTQEQLDNFINDPYNLNYLLLGSPTTDMYITLVALFDMVLKHNAQVKPGNLVVKVCINFYPFKPNKDIKYFYAKLLQQIHPNLRLNIMVDPLSVVPDSTLLTDKGPIFDIMYIHDFMSFIYEPSLSTESFAGKMLYLDTTICSPKRIDKSLPNLDLEKTADIFKQTEAALNLCCKFKYLPFHIPV